MTGALRPPNPLPPERDEQRWGDVVLRLKDIALEFKDDVQVSLSPPAEVVWRRFYTDFHKEDFRSETVAKVIERIPVYVMKTAMLYAIDRGETTISVEDLEASISFGQYAMRSASSLFGEITGSKTVRLEKRIERLLLFARPLELWKDWGAPLHGEKASLSRSSNGFSRTPFGYG